MFAFGKPSPRAGLAETLKYHLRDGIAEAISCPTLVRDEGDHFFKGRPQALYHRLTCPKTMVHFTEVEGAGAHSQSRCPKRALAIDAFVAGADQCVARTQETGRLELSDCAQCP
jgi:hypothetical protein